MKNRLLIVCSALIALAGATAIAQQPFVPPPGGVRFIERYRPLGAQGQTRVVGTVIDIRQVPVAYVKVQLRDLSTGTVEQEDTSDDKGEYHFDIVEPGTYVVEMIMVDGYVVALSNAGSLGRFETLQTVVQLPGRWDVATRSVVSSQNGAWYLGLSGQTSITAATLQFAFEQNITPRDAGEPVSP